MRAQLDARRRRENSSGIEQMAAPMARMPASAMPPN
jgi:hypothetical protein